MVGVDIVLISRIEKLLQTKGERFLGRVLHAKEQSLVQSPQSIAGFWAAKEAVAKALGCGIGSELGFLDIEIYKTAKGQPKLQLSQHIVQKYKIVDSSLSISHDGGFAIAVVAIEGQKH
ncbi:MAG: holo-ACP synthase [Campylobacterota bacterium]